MEPTPSLTVGDASPVVNLTRAGIAAREIKAVGGFAKWEGPTLSSQWSGEPSQPSRRHLYSFLHTLTRRCDMQETARSLDAKSSFRGHSLPAGT